MQGLTAAWLAGMGIVSWREWRFSGRAPVPGALLGVALLFAGLGLAADIAPRYRPVITLAAWGLDIAGLLTAIPAGLGGQIGKAQQATQAAEGNAPPSGVEVV